MAKYSFGKSSRSKSNKKTPSRNSKTGAFSKTYVTKNSSAFVEVKVFDKTTYHIGGQGHRIYEPNPNYNLPPHRSNIKGGIDKFGYDPEGRQGNEKRGGEIPNRPPRG